MSAYDLDDDPFAVAAGRGLRVVLPEPDQLLIDIDAPGDREWLESMCSNLTGNGIRATVESETVSPGGNLHAYVRIAIYDEQGKPRPLSPLERIALQACLGSDRHRELLSLVRVIRGASRPPTLFFEVAS